MGETFIPYMQKVGKLEKRQKVRTIIGKRRVEDPKGKKVQRSINFKVRVTLYIWVFRQLDSGES